uniref:Uncharacterized protein n=1 Tax=Acrobeloides nanus TaxID=290746 RepID=A0A914EI19_9BILA
MINSNIILAGDLQETLPDLSCDAATIFYLTKDGSLMWYSMAHVHYGIWGLRVYVNIKFLNESGEIVYDAGWKNFGINAHMTSWRRYNEKIPADRLPLIKHFVIKHAHINQDIPKPVSNNFYKNFFSKCFGKQSDD